MAKVNLYRIEDRDHRAFVDYLGERMNFIENKRVEDEGGEDTFNYSLYKIEEEVEKEIGWNWILNEFAQSHISVKTQPKAVLVIEYDDEMYAVTFGSAFFLVDKYCDRNFAFDFARRVSFLEIKTTTLLSPNMQRNKNVSTYINYEDLEFDSGESFAKLKAKLQLDDTQNALIGETIEFGNSIKFDLKVSSLASIGKLLKYIKTIMAKEEIHKIPVFKKVTDRDILEQLENNLYHSVQGNLNIISISELDIIGVSEIFNNQDTIFELWHGRKRKEIENLNFEEVEKFASEKEIELSKEILNIKVKSFNEGKSIRTDKIINLIDYIDDENRSVLNKGIWYHYNDDYQKYLEDSISEIPVLYYPEYNFSESIHQEFINEMFEEEKGEEVYKELVDEKIKEIIKKKYYAERAFNLLRVRDDFVNYDRNTRSYAGAQIELMDLYKNETMYAVKIGNASSTLCYAVDQSIGSLKMYKHNTLTGMPLIKNVAVWLILKRQPLDMNGKGEPDLNKLNMIMLKTKLDSWKKEVRLQGLNPIIYINYRQ